MNIRTTRNMLAVAAMSVAAAVALTTAGAAGPPDGPALTSVPAANEPVPGYAPASKLSPELTQQVVAQGSTLVENPSAAVSTYGYDNDVPAGTAEDGTTVLPQMVPTNGNPNTEAHKTEPDKNTYLVFPKGLPGADPTYNYGTHFLFQGHEGGSPGVITRINLDADAAHRVTVLATKDTSGANLKTIDGSTYDPWTHQLVFTTEGSTAPEYAATLDVPSMVSDISGSIGEGGYEGVQFDGDGNLWIVEDVGGSTRATSAKRPNSFVYRFVPTSPGDLSNGKLQVLQATNPSTGQPITFASQELDNNTDQTALYHYGSTFATSWLTIHDTATDGTTPYDANALAKAANGTPFKRPENGAFAPDSHFQQFFFTVTGDTNANSDENSSAGGWGGIFKLAQSSPSASTGQLTPFYLGDQAHTGLDNITFLSKFQVSAVEDAGKTLHDQRHALDSGYVFDIRTDYATGQVPVRWLAEGRDASATLDASAIPIGFGNNEDDNEITGIFVSDGDTSVPGLLGAHKPDLKADGDHKWRWFYTAQHGDNDTFEVLLKK
ncbi:MAG TPA: hypothetical protein VH274_05635 [Mycobacteriales bacterium]|nr:hypothetical protein [Mycobacteriales bacterium]